MGLGHGLQAGLHRKKGQQDPAAYPGWRNLAPPDFETPLVRFETKVRQVMVKASQFGVSMPGGTEALIHTRETLEAAIRADPSCDA